MGNKRNRQSRKLETPSAQRGMNNTQIETSNTGKNTLTLSKVNVQEGLVDNSLEHQLAESSQTSNEIQVGHRNCNKIVMTGILN